MVNFLALFVQFYALMYSDRDTSSYEILPNCASYIQVKLRHVTDGGDHDVAICEVIGTGMWDDGKQNVLWQGDTKDGVQSALDPSSALYSGQLRDDGII